MMIRPGFIMPVIVLTGFRWKKNSYTFATIFVVACMFCPMSLGP